jgi:hypothetical protein
MEPLCYVDDLPLPATDEILRRVSGHAGRNAQLEVLRLLCPCRNVCRDADVWRRVMSLYTTSRHHSGEVREAAHHAVKSLRERARMDTQTAELLRAIGAGADQRRHEWLWRATEPQFPKPVRNDVPTIIELLASDDAREREDAFRALFRTDRHVSRAVFDEIERKAHSGNERERRHAVAALRRIEERHSNAA